MYGIGVASLMLLTSMYHVMQAGRDPRNNVWPQLWVVLFGIASAVSFPNGNVAAGVIFAASAAIQLAVAVMTTKKRQATWVELKRGDLRFVRHQIGEIEMEQKDLSRLMSNDSGHTGMSRDYFHNQLLLTEYKKWEEKLVALRIE